MWGPDDQRNTTGVAQAPTRESGAGQQDRGNSVLVAPRSSWDRNVTVERLHLTGATYRNGALAPQPHPPADQADWPGPAA